jgi:hypothetical protein
LNELQLGTLLKTYQPHNDELQLASYIIKDDQKLTEEQEWKPKHEKNTPLVSVILDWRRHASVINWCIMLFLFTKWAWDETKCSTIIFWPKIVNSVHTSNESLHRRGATLSLTTCMNDDEQRNLTELTPMNTTLSTSSGNLPVGKR